MLNACDATPKDGRINISTSSVEVTNSSGDKAIEPGFYVVLTVQDTGEGIPEVMLEKVLEPFFTTKGIGQHSGLGLSMVEGFMTQSGGYLRVQSKVGAGTRVQLYFPAVFESAPVQTRAANVKTVTETGLVGCIMLIEDNESVSEIMQATLELHGHKVITASSADTALEVYKDATKIELVITDIAIPGKMQGPQLARYFQKSRPELPVIFVSGYSFGLEATEAGLLDSDILLTKPVRRKELIAVVNNMLVV